MGILARIFGLGGAGQASSATESKTSEAPEQAGGVDVAKANQYASNDAEVRGDTKKGCASCGGAGCSSCGCGNC
jgi:hypothetical protein